MGVTFFLNGFVFATWVSRIPDVRDSLSLDNGQLGLLLLSGAIGAVLALPTAGAGVHRFGTVAMIRAAAVLAAAGLALLAVTAELGIPVGAAVGLFAYGIGTSLWDVAMNVEGAEVERRLGRTIMPRFHAGFSLGTVAGAGLGALCTAIGVAPTWHIPVAVVLAVTIVVRSAGAAPPVEETGPPSARRSALAAWREPRVLLIGLMVLALALTEGTANDWLAVALVDGYDAAHWIAVTGFGAFVAAMTLGRWFGPILLDRHGRVVVLWGTMVAAGVGVLMVVYGGHPGVVVPGIVLWGLGASLGFPVGMSAAADDPAHAAARVSVVSTVGYAAFLGGPPFIGFVADHIGTLKALLVVAVLLVPSALVVPAARHHERP